MPLPGIFHSRGKVQMNAPIRRIEWPGRQEIDGFLRKEWLVTNGLGGYASGTVAGVSTRSFHGLLVAALPAPLGRTLLLGSVLETVRVPGGGRYCLNALEHCNEPLEMAEAASLLEFPLEMGLPVWRYALGDCVLEKRLWMPHRLNSVVLQYRLIEGRESLRLRLLPAVHFRPYDAPVSRPLPVPFRLTIADEQLELSGSGAVPPLRMTIEGRRHSFVVRPRFLRELRYRVEAARGYDSIGELYSPGCFRATVTRSS